MPEQHGRPSDQPDQPGEVPPPPHGQYGSGYGEQPTEPSAATAPGASAPPYGQQSPSYGQQSQPGYAPPGQQGYSAPGPQQGGYQQGGYPQPGYQPGYQQGGYQQGYARPAEMSPQDQRLWGCLAHVSSIASSVVGLTFLGPLVIYLVLRERGQFVRSQAAEALNFQILVNVVFLALGVVSVVTFGLGLLLYLPVGVAALVFVIIAAVKANQGVDYRYPVNWRLVK